jgi:hypothetical protein
MRPDELDAFFRDARHPPWHYVEIGDSEHLRVEPGYPYAGRFGRSRAVVRAGVGLAILPAPRSFGWHAANGDSMDSRLWEQGVRIRLNAMVLLVKEQQERECDHLLKALWSEDSEVKRQGLVTEWTHRGACLTEERLDNERMMTWELSPDLAHVKPPERGWISLVQNDRCKDNIGERGHACFLAVTDAGRPSPREEEARSWPHVSKMKINLEEAPLFSNDDRWTFRVACASDATPYVQDACVADDSLRLVVVEENGARLRAWSDRPPEIENPEGANGGCSVTATWAGPPSTGAVIRISNATQVEQNCQGLRLSVSPGPYLAQYGEPRRTKEPVVLRLRPGRSSEWEVWPTLFGWLLFGFLPLAVGLTLAVRSTGLSKLLLEWHSIGLDTENGAGDGNNVLANESKTVEAPPPPELSPSPPGGLGTDKAVAIGAPQPPAPPSPPPRGIDKDKEIRLEDKKDRAEGKNSGVGHESTAITDNNIPVGDKEKGALRENNKGVTDKSGVALGNNNCVVPPTEENWHVTLRRACKEAFRPRPAEVVDWIFVGLVVLFVWKWYGPRLPGQPTLPISVAHVAFFVVVSGTLCVFLMEWKRPPWLLALWVIPHVLVSWCFLYVDWFPTSLVKPYQAAFLEPSLRAFRCTMLRVSAWAAIAFLVASCLFLAWPKILGDDAKIANRRKGIFQGKGRAAVLAGVLLLTPTIESLAVAIGHLHPDAMPLIRRSIEALLGALKPLLLG